MSNIPAAAAPMRVVFEMLIKRRPVSVQTKNNANIQAWIEEVRRQAKKQWNRPAPLADEAFILTVVFLYESDPIDVDNIIKPIQDALNKVVYPDDQLITDVHSHRRLISDTLSFAGLPAILATAIKNQKECVYLQVKAGSIPQHLVL
jgi:crossover junction endodeoxyribonuclease RusA